MYIPSFIEIRSVVFEPPGWGVEICPFPLLWLLAFTTACTTVQAVITCLKCSQNHSEITRCLLGTAPLTINCRCNGVVRAYCCHVRLFEWRASETV